ncbi:MAG: hypothetical protein HDT22_08415 [Ruminococcus sp.]|nr:hypothetical protein [Ruminococcus sp.]
MNMKRIVFVAVGILIMLLIMGFTIYNINHIDEINQKRREQDKGEAIASRMVATTATTSIWDSLRATETEMGNTEENTQNVQETFQESGEMLETEFTQEYEIENQVSTETITEIITEPVTEDEKYSVVIFN